MTTEWERQTLSDSARDAVEKIARQAEADALLARLDGRRRTNDRLGLSERDSTDILRELREHGRR